MTTEHLSLSAGGCGPFYVNPGRSLGQCLAFQLDDTDDFTRVNPKCLLSVSSQFGETLVAET